jgi:hypothetical protein
MGRLSRKRLRFSGCSTCRTGCSSLFSSLSSVLFRTHGRVEDSIDQILASDALNIRDHLSLAASSRILRSVYYTSPRASGSNGSSRAQTSGVWTPIVRCRPLPVEGKASSAIYTPLLEHLWTRVLRIEPEQMTVLDEEGGAVRSDSWNKAVEAVHSQVRRLFLILSSVFSSNASSLTSLCCFSSS